jgi:hypothetical protein
MSVPPTSGGTFVGGSSDFHTDCGEVAAEPQYAMVTPLAGVLGFISENGAAQAATRRQHANMERIIFLSE